MAEECLDAAACRFAGTFSPSSLAVDMVFLSSLMSIAGGLLPAVIALAHRRHEKIFKRAITAMSDTRLW